MARRARERRRRSATSTRFAASWLVARSFDRHTFDLLDRRRHDGRRAARRRRTSSRSAASSICRDCRRASWPDRTTASRGCIYYRRIGRGGEGVLDLPAYAGVSLEAGNTWIDREDVSFGDLRKDASLFFGARYAARTGVPRDRLRRGRRQGVLSVPGQDVLSEALSGLATGGSADGRRCGLTSR